MTVQPGETCPTCQRRMPKPSPPARVHLPDPPVGTREGRPNVSLCGYWAGGRLTEDPSEVTCHWCLKYLERHPPKES